ncbi:MAG: hypothetical protein ACLQF2_14535 [Rhodomicrobium sp.]
MPAADQTEMIARFQKGNSLQYRAALAELVIHAALKRHGYNMRLHPPCGHPTRKPDFEVQNAETKQVAIVEVTTFNPAADEVAQGNRDAAVYNALDKADIPAGWRIGLDIINHGKKPASLTKICKAVGTWAKEVAGDDPIATPRNIFDADDWSIEITLYGGFSKEKQAERMIATAMGDLRLLKPHEEIRQAVQLKGNRYGKMVLPYLIVVADCKDELQRGRSNARAALEAMFGTVVTKSWKDENDKWVTRDVYDADGYWGFSDAPRQRQVSGILILPKPHIWHLRDEGCQPVLVRNPWATQPLPNDFLRLPGWDYKQDHFKLADGANLADIIGLPAIWPPE